MADTGPAPIHEPAPPLSRLWLLALLPAGFVFGLLGGFMQEHRLLLGDIAVPWASVLVVVTLVVTIRALSMNMETRLAGALFYFGWVVATGLLAVPNPSGDIVFTADIGAFGYLLAGGVLGAAVAVWPLFLGAAEVAPRADSDD